MLTAKMLNDLPDVMAKWCPDDYEYANPQTRLIAAFYEADACAETLRSIALHMTPVRPLNSFKPYRDQK